MIVFAWSLARGRLHVAFTLNPAIDPETKERNDLPHPATETLHQGHAQVLMG